MRHLQRHGIARGIGQVRGRRVALHRPAVRRLRPSAVSDRAWQRGARLGRRWHRRAVCTAGAPAAGRRRAVARHRGAAIRRRRRCNIRRRRRYTVRRRRRRRRSGRRRRRRRRRLRRRGQRLHARKRWRLWSGWLRRLEVGQCSLRHAGVNLRQRHHAREAQLRARNCCADRHRQRRRRRRRGRRRRRVSRDVGRCEDEDERQLADNLVLVLQAVAAVVAAVGEHARQRDGALADLFVVAHARRVEDSHRHRRVIGANSKGKVLTPHRVDAAACGRAHRKRHAHSPRGKRPDAPTSILRAAGRALSFALVR